MLTRPAVRVVPGYFERARTQGLAAKAAQKAKSEAAERVSPKKTEETMSETLYGVCGLLCSGCPAYEATQANDAAKIAATAKEWSKTYQADIRPEHVWCEGCTTPGRKCMHCAECELRRCAQARTLSSCADCSDYSACTLLAGFLSMVPGGASQSGNAVEGQGIACAEARS